MSKKLLIISGPTATGKTALSIELAKQFNGELISADSRQIYIGMDIGTGKDHPKNTVIHMVDIIDPDKDFSAAEYRHQVLDLIKKIHNSNKLPIVVGGTGFYIDSLIKQVDTYSIKPSWLLRNLLNRFSVKSLQNILRLLDSKTFNHLNNSDRNNPHRLIRKIEISLKSKFRFAKKSEKAVFDFLHISLTAPNNVIYSRIDSRVEERGKAGLIEEINKLVSTYGWNSPGLNSIAYKEFKTYFENPSRENLENSIKEWKYDEHAYARRQKTWFKKRADIYLSDITEKDYKQTINEIISKWYNTA